MTPEEMRVQLIQAYPSSKAWAARVNRMADHQVFAIFMRVLNRKKN